MTAINRTDVVFSNSFLSFSARDIPVLDTKKQAEIHFLWCFKCSFEFSAFLVPVLNVKKCLEVTENFIQGNRLSFNTDTKNAENSKEQFK